MHQNQWVVRSSGRVLGPFTTEEIVRRLESRNLSPIDEVAAPFSRWSYIREKSQFAEITERLQSASYSGKEDTKTATITTQTQTHTLTDLGDDFEKTEITELPGIKDIKVERKRDIAKKPVRSYGDASVSMGKSSNWSQSLWLVAGVLVIGLVGYVGFFQSHSGTVSVRTGGALQMGHLALELGHYDEARHHFAKAYAKNPDDADTVLNYSALLIANGETTQGERIFEKIFGYSHLSNDTRRKANLLMGIAATIDGDYAKAAAYFERHTNLASPEGPFVPATFNLGFVYSLSGDFAKADEIFMNSINKIDDMVLSSLPFSYPKDGFFYRSYNLALQYRKTGDNKNLMTAMKAAQESVKRSPRFRTEALLLLGWMAAKNNNPRVAQSYIRQMLDTDPSLYRLHVRSLFVYNDYVDWKKMAWFCRDMANNLPGDARLSAALALCEFKADNSVQVQRHLKDATSMAPNDALVRAIESFMLIEKDDYRRADTVLGLATRSEQIFSLPYLLKGKNCWEKSDRQCALKNWQVAFNRNPTDVVALTGLATFYKSYGKAEIKEANGQRGIEVAKTYVEQAYRVSPSYRPILELKNEMDRLY